MFYDILGFIDGPRPDANGTADDTQWNHRGYQSQKTLRIKSRVIPQLMWYKDWIWLVTSRKANLFSRLQDLPG